MKKQHSLTRRIFSRSLLIINILLVAWSVICWLAAYISPAKIKYLAISNITLPFIIIANIFFIVFWLIFSSRKSLALLSLLTLVCGYKVFLTVFGLNFFSANDVKSHDNTITVLSWNVHGMGIFGKHSKQTAKKILEEIQDEHADIVCLPEYYVMKDDSSGPYNQVIRSYGYNEYRFCFDNKIGKRVCIGTGIFSKYPLTNYSVRPIGNELINVIQCDIELKENKKIRLVMLHLHSFGFSDGDKVYIEELKNNTLETPIHSEVFTWKFNYAYGMRALEADTVSQIIEKSPYPVLVCGDLNDLPGSYTYMKVRGQLSDAFLDKGKWIGRTYNEIAPTLRIDHIFYDPSVLEIIGYRSPALRLSDHRPVVAHFKIL